MNVNPLTVPNSLLRCFWHTTRLLFRHTVCSLIPTSSISVSKISWNWLVAWWIVCMQNVSKRRWLTSLISFPKYQGIPCVTDCVMAELEKLGHRFRIALRWVRCHGACIKKSWFYIFIVSRATLGLNVYDVHIQVPMPMIVWYSGSRHINASLSLPVTENYAGESVKYPVCRWCISRIDDMPSSVFQIRALRVEIFYQQFKICTGMFKQFSSIGFWTKKNFNTKPRITTKQGTCVSLKPLSTLVH